MPSWRTEVTRRVRRHLRSFATKEDGAVAVAREKEVRWQRKPESISRRCLDSGLANLRRKMREVRS